MCVRSPEPTPAYGLSPRTPSHVFGPGMSSLRNGELRSFQRDLRAGMAEVELARHGLGLERFAQLDDRSHARCPASVADQGLDATEFDRGQAGASWNRLTQRLKLH